MEQLSPLGISWLYKLRRRRASSSYRLFALSQIGEQGISLIICWLIIQLVCILVKAPALLPKSTSLNDFVSDGIGEENEGVCQVVQG